MKITATNQRFGGESLVETEQDEAIRELMYFGKRHEDA